MKHLIAFVAACSVATGIALAQDAAPSPSPAPIAPSAVVASATTYDKQTITVTGTVKGVTTRQSPRGTVTMFQLCDTQCVNVVQAGDQTAAPVEGATQTLTGRFRAEVSFGDQHDQNLLIVGMHGGRGGRGHRPMPSSTP